MDWGPPASSVHGILQANILEWVALPSSRGSSQPRDGTSVSYVSCNWQTGSLPLALPGKPVFHRWTHEIAVLAFPNPEVYSVEAVTKRSLLVFLTLQFIFYVCL